jgi:hypothetical protein
MKATHVSAWLFAAAVAGGGCAGTGEVAYSGNATMTSPDLVYVEPGVQVVADADEPLFYADGSYWLYRDNMWMRSDSYRGGWARVDVVPAPIREIREPRAYIHYRHDVQAREPMQRQREQRPMPYQRDYDTQPSVVPPPANPIPQRQPSPGPQPPNQPQVPVDQRPMPDHHDMNRGDHHDDGDHDRTDRNMNNDRGERRAPEPTKPANRQDDPRDRNRDR